MNTVLLKHIADHVGKTVTLTGWLYTKRSGGSIHFLQFRDGTGYIQAIIGKNEVSSEIFEAAKTLTAESALELTGLVKAEPRSPYGYELLVKGLKILHRAPEQYPISKQSHSVGFLLKHRTLWLNMSPKQQAIQKIRHTIVYAIYDFYEKNDFTKIDTPIFTPNACEGTTTLFGVDYFGDTAYLSQSGQLYLEAVLPAFRRVFDFSPVFRAEKSKTRRHLTEFWMTNAESAFTDHDQNLKIQENLVHHILKAVLAHNRLDLKTLGRDVSKLSGIKPPFPRLTYEDAVQQLRTLGSDIKEGADLGNDDETLLTQQYDQPLFIQYYPAAVKAFYMKRLESDESKAKCADLLAPEGYGEMIGGSERETDYHTLVKSLHAHNLPESEFQWYMDIRKYGSVPHSGFGLGLERTVTWICGLKHVRTAIPFPRTINRLRP